MDQAQIDRWHMQRALELAAGGRGYVEPNPLVGCVVANGAEMIGEGWHREFGGDHAEVEALKLAGERAEGATMYVTLEPCCHQGKTPPCSKAVIASKVRRVVIAQRDPFPKVDGGGVDELKAAGIEVEVGLMEKEAQRLNAPYLKLLHTGRPWIIAKWAMTLDGKIATRNGSSRWISGEKSREIVHAIRGRVDAVMVGSQTARQDNPQLTARPPGPRMALRVVLDTHASLPSESHLVHTAREFPVLVAIGPTVTESGSHRLTHAGCEVLVCQGETPSERLDFMLAEFGRRRLTNVLVEGGSRLLGSLMDAQAIDEVHVFVAPKLVGGVEAPSAMAGVGIEEMAQALRLETLNVQQVDEDVYLHGLVSHRA